jgi:hypothetical protein
MHELRQWLDGLARRLCEWLNDAVPGHHALAVAGNGLAGLSGAVLLPVDRRVGPEVMPMAGATHFDATGKYHVVGTGVAKEDRCGFWAYCHMNGFPCVWKGGLNYLPDAHGRVHPRAANVDPDNLDAIQGMVTRHLCPRGKRAGFFWTGCCENPADGRVRLIGFYDCCGSGAGGTVFERCKNWPGAKHWCDSSGTSPLLGPNSYYCTVAVDMGECPTDYTPP